MLNEECLTGKAVVIGAGTMGGGIAAQLANAGWHVHLLDTTREAALEGLARVQAGKPPLLFLPEFAERIAVGSTADGLDVLCDADWVVEAAFEDMAVKQAVMAQIEAHAGPQTLVSSNTSGLSLSQMTRRCGAEFRARFLGSHFLNPPRYLKLLEVIPLPETNSEIADGFIRFAEQVLGHRVVQAKDTPGFVSTRVGIWHLLDSIHTALDLGGLTVEEADTVTGALLGRPRTGTFRLADVIGLDILAAIGRDLHSRLPHDPKRDRFLLPPVLERLLAQGRTGDKAGAGFYKRDGKQTLALDLNTGEYRPRQEVLHGDVEVLLRLPLSERLVTLKQQQSMPWSRFVNGVVDSLSQYVSQIGPEIANNTNDIDRVMQWGFGWEMGPFEIAHLRSNNKTSLFANIVTSTKENKEVQYFTLSDIKTAETLVLDTPEGSLVDMGDGVACLEYHTKMNTFSPALSAFVDQARVRAEQGFRALVIANDARHFSAGYNLHLFLEAAQAGDWAGLDTMLRSIQSTFLGLKYARIPVVAAPHGYTLGAGCESVLHCAAVVAAPELVIGLPELSVGVLPAGGGTTQMLVRALSETTLTEDVFPHIERAFDQLSQPRNSANAYDARQRGFLRPTDIIVHNADCRLYEAKRHALTLVEADYQPPPRQSVRVLGEETLARLRRKSHDLNRAGRMTDHDRLIADKIAYVLSGGNLPYAQDVTEEYLLSLERQVFLELMHEPKTIVRMRSVLEMGKTLQN